MPHTAVINIAAIQSVAALVFELNANAANYPEGCNAHIFPDGPFRSDDGRPASVTGGELLDWQMNADVAARLIATLAASGKPILYDYEHNSLYGDSRAAGWIDKLVHVPGQGLFAHVEWTPDAAEDVAKKVYRYSSPCFAFDPKTGAVTKLLSVALTNNPALTELGAVGLHKQAVISPGGKEGMDQLAALTSQVAALTKERDELKASVAALTTECVALKAEKEAAAAEQEKAKHTDLLQAALTDGRLTPAQKPWAEKQSLAALTEYLDATKPLPLAGDPQAKPGEESGNHGLTKDELVWCSKMGVTPEQYSKTKQSLNVK